MIAKNKISLKKYLYLLEQEIKQTNAEAPEQIQTNAPEPTSEPSSKITDNPSADQTSNIAGGEMNIMGGGGGLGGDMGGMSGIGNMGGMGDVPQPPEMGGGGVGNINIQATSIIQKNLKSRPEWVDILIKGLNIDLFKAYKKTAKNK